MNNIEILKDLSKQANRIEDEGKVDPTLPDVLKNLSKLKDETKKIESMWVERKDTNSFYFYNAIKCVELILEKMIERFTRSQENHDNPQIAVDTLALIPNIVEVVEIAETDKTDEQTIEKIIERTYQLRNKAAVTNLLESEKRNLQGIDTKRVLETLDGIAKQLGIPEELQDDVTADDDEEDLS